jgi:hypothetical protein
MCTDAFLQRAFECCVREILDRLNHRRIRDGDLECRTMSGGLMDAEIEMEFQ